jgi:hypothetical protein
LQCRRGRKRCVSYKVAIGRSWECVKEKESRNGIHKGGFAKEKKDA